jgi:broad specificity phosphatase PhoE
MQRMGTLYLVRHGQASFGAADYDQLSQLGTQQCQALGAWMRRHGLQFDGVLCGTLRRHQQTLAALVEGYGDGHADADADADANSSANSSASASANTDANSSASASANTDGNADADADANAGAMPPALPWPGLNEYDSAALIHAIHPEPLAPPDTPEVYKAHFRLLRDAMLAWMAGRTAPQGMPAYADWVAGITGALDHVRSQFSANPSSNVLIVSSGGPIATAVGHVLGTTPEATIALNLRIRNSAVTEFDFNPKRMQLVSFNHLPHLDALERRGWLTHA